MSPGLATRGRLLLQVPVTLFLVKPGLRVGVGHPELVQVSAGCEHVELSGWGTQGAGEMVPAQGLCVCSSVPDSRCGGSGGLVSEQPLFWKIKPPSSLFPKASCVWQDGGGRAVTSPWDKGPLSYPNPMFLQTWLCWGALGLISSGNWAKNTLETLWKRLYMVACPKQPLLRVSLCYKRP